MSDNINNTMNLKLNNETKSPTTTVKSAESLVKEERRRTGRYIAILVGIMLFILALYHAWVRRIPVVASLVVPALIMFLYVAWVLYTASRDKHRLLDMEAALAARNEAEREFHTPDCQNLEISVVSKDTSGLNTPEERRWSGIPAAFLKGGHRDHNGFIMPIILINDEPPEDLDQKWLNIVEKQSNSDKLKGFHSRRKFKRKFCRKRRFAAFKRSYSIG